MARTDRARRRARDLNQRCCGLTAGVVGLTDWFGVVAGELEWLSKRCPQLQPLVS